MRHSTTAARREPFIYEPTWTDECGLIYRTEIRTCMTFIEITQCQPSVFLDPIIHTGGLDRFQCCVGPVGLFLVYLAMLTAYLWCVEWSCDP
jgi:hypothetical protein